MMEVVMCVADCPTKIKHPQQRLSSHQAQRFKSVMKFLGLFLLASSSFFLHQTSVNGIEVSQGLTALRLAQNLASSSVVIQSASLTGYEEQWGIFSDGASALGIDKGVVMSSTSTDALTAVDYDLPGGGKDYSPLTKLLVGKTGSGQTYDATTLTIRFTCLDSEDTSVSFKYVFASNEYPTYGSSEHEDLMGAFLNGKDASNNLATVNGRFVSVNNVYKGSKFIDNSDEHLDVQVRGLTVPLTSKVGILKSDGATNTLVIAIADGGYDHNVGSYVFLEKDSLKCF